jgi:hypothetical protein
MSARGMTFILATSLAEAVAKDEAPEQGGFDLSAGMFGEHVSAWLREVAAALASPPLGSKDTVVAFHDKDQPEGIAWCPGFPEALRDITPLYYRGTV